jgi:hypothetical protein
MKAVDTTKLRLRANAIEDADDPNEVSVSLREGEGVEGGGMEEEAKRGERFRLYVLATALRRPRRRSASDAEQSVGDSMRPIGPELPAPCNLPQVSSDITITDSAGSWWLCY